MQRSGSTLQYELVKKILTAIGKSYSEYGFAQREDERDVLRFFRCTVADFCLVKTHDFLDVDVIDKVVIYSWRDIRDVAASIKNKFGKKDKILLATIDRCVREHYKIIKVSDVTHSYHSLVNEKEKCLLELVECLGFSQKELDVGRVIESLEHEKILVEKTTPIGSLKSRMLRWSNTSAAKKISSKLQLSKSFKAAIREGLVRGGVGAFHYGHITKNNGESGTYAKYLSEDEIEYINDNYQGLYEKE